ncbi:hypothetical protein DRN79_03440 [Methanosarcinales archaeon]|nr:MAG: hypothetical protein DRN79_03440 [Methanosarcinales archaeon]
MDCNADRIASLNIAPRLLKMCHPRRLLRKVRWVASGLVNIITVQDGGRQAVNRPSLFECCMVFPTSQMASEAKLSSQ